MKPKPNSVAIAYCHPGKVEGLWAESMFRVLRHSFDTVAGTLGIVSGPRIATARNELVKSFLELTQADWLFMVDTDMLVPANILEALLEHADPEEAPIVSALCFGTEAVTGRHFPTIYIVIDEQLMRDPAPDLDADKIRVDATGAAVLLIHRKVLEAMRDVYNPAAPWFAFVTFGQRELGEDITFCLRAREMGFPIWVIPGVETGHVKPMVLNRATWDAQDAEVQRSKIDELIGVDDG